MVRRTAKRLREGRSGAEVDKHGWSPRDIIEMSEEMGEGKHTEWVQRREKEGPKGRAGAK